MLYRTSGAPDLGKLMIFSKFCVAAQNNHGCAESSTGGQGLIKGGM